MKKILFFLFFIILIININGIIAPGFSPTSLTFQLNIREKQCQMINIISDSEIITVSDKWAENKDVEQRVSLFEETSDYHSLIPSYPKQLSKDERRVEVCLLGNEAGEYHGVILFKEQQKGSSIIQMGIWIKAVIGNEQEIAEQERKLLNRTRILEKQEINQKQEIKDNKIEEKIGESKVSEDNSGAGITANVISEQKSLINKNILFYIILGIFILIALIIGIKIYNRKRNIWV